jgi:hypothetical protein
LSVPARGNTTDDYGVPLNIMGRHPEAFFSILGRIVALSATLEYQVLVFHQYLVGRDQTAFTTWGVAKLLREGLKEINRLLPPDRELAEAWLREAKVSTEKRNDYAHNMWPAQVDGHLFGWRIPNRPNAQASIMTQGTMEEMQGDLDRLIALLETRRLHRIQGLVSGGQHLRLREP